MTELFAAFGLSSVSVFLLVLCGMLIGMSKTGIQGIGSLVVPIMALIFGAKPSTGLLLPMLCMADVMAVLYYRTEVKWRYIFALLPWAILGFFVALLVDAQVPESQFRKLIGATLFIGFLVMFWNERRQKSGAILPEGLWFAALFGILGGFSTMIGNAAGPIMAVFLLAARLPKNAFVGTSAWFFLIVNFLKLPLQFFFWHNISASTLALNAAMLPAIFLGALIGIWFVRLLSERNYRRFVTAATLISTMLLFL